MESFLIKILELMQATPADYFNFFIGVVVVGYIVTLKKRIKMLEEKYHLLNLSTVRLWDRVDPNMVNDHYSGDYSIKRKANVTVPQE